MVRSVVAGGAELAVEVSGAGVPVVFLHANVCDRRMWRSQVAAVGASNKAVAYDRRGFGETRAAAAEHSAVADLLAVLDATAGGEPAVLVGCSLGGRIALDAALGYPARVRGLVLIATNVTGAPPPVYTEEAAALMARLRALEVAGDLDVLNAMKARLFLDGPLAPEGRVSGAARDLFLAMSGVALRASAVGKDVDAAPLYDRLGEVAVPSLVLCGTLDFPHVQARSRHVAATIPHATGHALPGAAHLPGLEPEDAVTSHLLPFLARFGSDASN